MTAKQKYGKVIETVLVKVSTIKIDPRVNPRPKVDPVTIQKYSHALRGGAEFPPIIVEYGTHRLVAGRHRLGAVVRVRGKDAFILAEVKRYADEEELFAEAVESNKTHGLAYTTYDIMHCIKLSRRFRMLTAKLCDILGITEQRLAGLTVTRIGSYDGKPVILKHGCEHLAGCELTRPQRDIQPSLLGIEHARLIQQVIGIVASGVIDRRDETLMQRLVELRDLLNRKI